MKLIAGLGNPGSKYENTRHNIGFWALDFINEKLKTRLNPGKGQWLEGYIKINGEDVHMIKPLDYMNNSGFVIGDFLERKNLKINTQDLLVIIDDFQLPLGTIRFRKNGSDGGHNGLSNIIYHLNSVEIPRMRIGIGKDTPVKSDEYVEFVLGNFTKKETDVIIKLKPVLTESILNFINNGITDTMNKYNKHHLSDKEEIKTNNSNDNQLS